MIRWFRSFIVLTASCLSLSLLWASEARSASVIYTPTCWAGCDGSAHFYGIFNGVLYQELYLSLDVSSFNVPIPPTNPPGPAHPIGSSWFLSGGDVNVNGFFDAGNGLPTVSFALSNHPSNSQTVGASWAIDMTVPGIFFPTVTAFGYVNLRYRDGEYNGFSVQLPLEEFHYTFSPVTIAPVPGPIVGAGLPGILITIAGFIGWRRSRCTLRV